ncbi:MAG: UDP-N-acetylglucosamine 2-epimerase (non-hydrolyzing) [Candidatus Berkelbacteria bacterium]
MQENKKPKVITVLGTRPEIIRLSRVMATLDQFCDHKVLHTGQNFDKTLNDIFFEELKIRKPDHVLDSKSASAMGQIGIILEGCEKYFQEEKPDSILILGDTNSALSAIVAKRMGIPVFHMEAGNRCYDDRVPEEVNRRIVDHSSEILLPYTERSRANLLAEGITSKKIYVTGNPILEVLNCYQGEIDKSDVMDRLGVEKGKYFLVTLHRAENVDVSERLTDFIEAFKRIYDKYKMPIVLSVHPRTRSQLEKQGKSLGGEGMIPLEPMGLFDFVHLEKNAFCALSDSGTVQEECAIFGVPNVTLRDVTERPETIEAGSNFIAGSDPETILLGVEIATSSELKWEPPKEYIVKNVSDIITRIVLSFWKK